MPISRIFYTLPLDSTIKRCPKCSQTFISMAKYCATLSKFFNRIAALGFSISCRMAANVMLSVEKISYYSKEYYHNLKPSFSLTEVCIPFS